MISRTPQALAASILLLLVPLTSWSQSSTSVQAISTLERSVLSPDRSTIEMGSHVARTACVDCHGMNGISTAQSVPHLAGQRTIYLYRVLQAYKSGERRNEEMNQATSFLNDEALLAVSAYYASLAPARPTLADELGGAVKAGSGDPFTGIRDAMKKCVKCHGEDGNATASGMPNLSAQDPEYFVASMKDYAEKNRDHKMMTKLVAKLDGDTLARMGVFYAVQEPARTETAGNGNSDLGRALSEPCAACHGDDGNASGADMPTLAGQDARYFTKAMQAYKDGKRRHQSMFDAVNSLTETDVDNLATFYATQEPLRRNVRSPLTTTEWIDRCERCHGIGGNSNDPRFPMLAGQDRTYLMNALESYLGNTRSNTTMHAMSDPLSKSDIEQIVEYYAAQEPKSVVYMLIPCEE